MDTVTYTGSAASVTVSLNDAKADDGAAGEGDNVGSDVENVTGGSGNDTLAGNVSPNRLVGNDGSDTLVGSGGSDDLQGGNGDDGIFADDGAVDTVSCGAGVDQADVDGVDTVSADCETVTRPAIWRI